MGFDCSVVFFVIFVFNMSCLLLQSKEKRYVRLVWLLAREAELKF